MRLKPPYDARYRLEDSLGAGAQATVYKAEDRTTGERVALKLLVVGSGERDASRLVREARALASVVHPTLPRFHDLHSDHDPPLLVMEAVEGTELRLALDQGRRWTADELAPLGQALAEGLAMLHAKGVVHRDLKPENLMLAAGGPRLLDLGLAHLEGDTTITRTGAAVGTPLYFAPEQFERRPATTASDVFSLGVILHEMLTGERPYSLLHLSGQSAGVAWPREPQARLAEALGRVAGRCLSRDPKARPDAEELAVALRHGGTWETRETSRPLDHPEPAASRGARFGALAVLGIALGAWLAGSPGRPGPASLELLPYPGGVEARWQGSPADTDLAFMVEGASPIPLPARAGEQRLRIPLAGPTHLRVTRSGRAIPAGTPPQALWSVAPAPVPPASAAGLARGPGGLELVLGADAGPWAPDHVELLQGGERVELARAPGPGPVRYPLEGPLDGDSPLEIWPLVRGEDGAPRRVGDGPWIRWQGALQQRRVQAAEDGTGRLGPAEAARTIPYELVRLPHILLHSRIYSATHRAASKAGKRRLWFPVLAGGEGYLAGRTLDPEEPLQTFRISETPAFFAHESHVMDLGRSLAFRYWDRPDFDQGAMLWVWRGSSSVQRVPLDRTLWNPIGGPYTGAEGGAFFVGKHLRVRTVDADGRLSAPDGIPTPRGFRVRLGDQRSGQRWLALAMGAPLGRPARFTLGVFDRQDPRRRTLIDGLPEEPPCHPLVVEEGPHAGIYLVLGERIQRLALSDVVPAPGEVERSLTLEALIRARSLETVATLRARDAGANLRFPRAQPISDGPYGMLPVLDAEPVPGMTPEKFLGQPVAFRRFRALVVGPAGPKLVDLDAGPFPTIATGIPQVTGDLDGRRGLGVVLADGHGNRAALELWDLVTTRPLIRWELHVDHWALSPTLLGDHVYLGASPGHSLDAALPPLGPMSP